MKTTCLESQTLEKLNKILMNTSVKFKHNEKNQVIMSFGRYEITLGWWHNLSDMLFSDLSIFKRIRVMIGRKIYVDAFKQFCEAGLMTLEGCSSLEEVLLRLEVMFPDL